jgi:hypothetical protein
MDVSSSFTSSSHLCCVFYFNPIKFFKIWFRIRQQNTSGNGKGQSPPTPILVINVDHRIVGIISFVLVNPLSATPLISPSSFARAACAVRSRGFHAVGSESRTSPKLAARRLLRQCTIGTSPCRCGDGFSCHRVSPDLSAMASPTLVMDPSDVTRRIVESNLSVVWRGSQRVNLSVCVCMWL